MGFRKIESGDNPPEYLNAIIEIPKDGSVKYELDKNSGIMAVDRFLYTAMFYPFNYGFIPRTLASDKDPLDIIVISSMSVIPGCILKVRVIGMLEMEDENGKDEKIISVPISKIDSGFDDIQDINDVPKVFLDQIKHFFENYKTLEPEKWVKLENFVNKEKAMEIILETIEKYKEK
jgi:inorganic pyrophosphatase